MGLHINVLLITDDAAWIREMLREVEGVTFALEHVRQLADGMRCLRETDGGDAAACSIDVVLLDLGLSDTPGTDALSRVLDRAAHLPLIVLTDRYDESLVSDAFEQGAQDYLVKDRVDTEVLVRAIRYAIERKRARDRLRQYAEEQAALNAIAAAAVSSLDPDTVLRQILEKACDVLDAVEGAILLHPPESEALEFFLTLGEETAVMRGECLTPGQGIAGWVAQHAEGVYVNDVTQDPRWYGGVDARTEFETRSLLCVPLLSRGDVIGVIEIVNKRSGAFTADDLRFMQSASSFIAVAIENTRLFEDIQSHAGELALLNKITLALTSTLDFSTVVDMALAHVQDLFEAETVALFEVNVDAEALALVRMWVEGEPIGVSARLEPGEGIAGWTMQQRMPVVVADAQTDPRFAGFGTQPVVGVVRGMMAVPLQIRDRLIGVLDVTSSRPDAYSLDDLRMLQALGATLAVALENARLYEESQALLADREQAQAQLIISEKMAAIGRLAASLAHEINNPLQALRSGFRLLLNPDIAEAKRLRYLEVANREIERLTVIVQRMLGFYRPASGEAAPVDVNDLLDDTLLLVGRKMEHSRVLVRRRFSSDLPPVTARPDQLKQVFLNLILNAQQAMPGGGELVVATAHDAEVETVHIRFSDTGVGIPADKIPRLFEPLFTMRPGGSGMGLAISYGIVEQHGGYIEVESEVEVGSSFTVVLPVDGGREMGEGETQWRAQR
jgi:two-component system NtrC family sensor kinase